ncbi:hypothetical protein [uncultured Sphingomonas sp.]|uniref:hypothetical protein n=1 Tax=uncultured Sphingomonas sp. TaxID=158754 RepID=UPI0035CA1B35
MTVPPSTFQAGKLWLVDHFGLAKDALHIYVGLTLFLLAALLFRWPVSSWRPWAVAVGAAMLGELADLRDVVAFHMTIHLADNWHDIWNTSFWPTVIMVLARNTRLFRR